MRSLKIAAVCAAMVMAFTLSSAAASPVLNSSVPAADSTSASGAAMRSGRNAEGGLMEGAESLMDDMLPGDTGTADSSLGDTNGDGAIESSEPGGGIMDSESGMNSGSDTDRGTESSGGSSSSDEATDTAQSSSGGNDDNGMGVWGVILTVVIIGAAAALLFALLPKRRNG